MVSKLRDVWSILFLGASLHKSWQKGYDEGTISEYRRLITNRAYLAEVRGNV